MKTILVIADDPALLSLEQKTLRDAGFDADAATDGEEARTKLKDVPYAGIVLDVTVAHGYTLAGQIEGLNANRNTPLIIVGPNEPDARKRAFEAGALVFLAKPFGVETFRSVVQSVISPPTPGTSGARSPARQPAPPADRPARAPVAPAAVGLPSAPPVGVPAAPPGIPPAPPLMPSAPPGIPPAPPLMPSAPAIPAAPPLMPSAPPGIPPAPPPMPTAPLTEPPPLPFELPPSPVAARPAPSASRPARRQVVNADDSIPVSVGDGMIYWCTPDPDGAIRCGRCETGVIASADVGSRCGFCRAEVVALQGKPRSGFGWLIVLILLAAAAAAAWSLLGSGGWPSFLRP